jgi:hypothetical protein
MNSVRKVTALFFAMACASAPSTTRTESNGNVALVQIQNDHYSEAVVFVEGARLTEVRGGTHTLVLLPIARIPPYGEIRFTVRLRALNESIQLPIVQYRPGRAIRIVLKPQLPASTAQE